LLGATLALVALGILVIWSTSFKATSLASSGDTVKQILSAAIGLTVMAVLARADYHIWSRLAPWLYGLTLPLLVWVKLFAPQVLGAQRWVNIGFFQFQPSEVVKLVLILGLARFLARHYDRLESPRYLILSIIYMAAPVVLVMMQPDLGTALVLIFTWAVMVLASRVRKVYVAGLGLAGLAILPLVLSHLPSYQKARLTCFLNPQATLSSALGDCHNVIQSMIAIGSGQVLGRGLAAGSQSQLNFLPSQHTDFIFAVLGEKMGFVGGVLLIILFGVILWRGLVIAYGAKDRFGFFLAVGIVAMLSFHVAINIGMNMGLAPVTGIPLPLVSYGGTSLLMNLIGIGLLESIARRRVERPF
jgi:rod shape determining protein RodA